MHTPARTALVAIILACVVVVASCERGDEFGRRYHLHGKVAYKGQPVKSAAILFIPVKEGLSATGYVDNGVYRNLRTRLVDDGILPGRYRVTLFPLPPDPSRPRPAGEGADDKGKPAAGVVTTAGVSIPEKYTIVGDTPLEIDVTPTTFAVDFDLQD